MQGESGINKQGHDNLSEIKSTETLKIWLREKARKVWVSFGIFMIVIPFMDGYQIVCF